MDVVGQLIRRGRHRVNKRASTGRAEEENKKAKEEEEETSRGRTDKEQVKEG